MKPPVYSLTDFRIRAENIGSARKRMREIERSARAKPGVIQYHFLQDMEDPTIFTAYGIFASGRDLDAYFASIKEAADGDPEVHGILDPEYPPSIRSLDRI